LVIFGAFIAAAQSISIWLLRPLDVPSSIRLRGDEVIE
jgi:hypothetical protein